MDSCSCSVDHDIEDKNIISEREANLRAAMLPSEDDVQTYMARFESLRSSTVQGKRNTTTTNRRVMVTHKELDRQCRYTVRLEESARRVDAAEARRDRGRVQDRLGRIRTDQRRYKADTDRRREAMEAEDLAHAERSREIRDSREKLAEGQRGGTKVRKGEMLERIAKMSLPVGVKQLLKAQFLSSSYLKSPTPPPQDPTPEDATPQNIPPPLQDPQPPLQGHTLPIPPLHDHTRLSVSSPTNSEPFYIETLFN